MKRSAGEWAPLRLTAYLCSFRRRLIWWALGEQLLLLFCGGLALLAISLLAGDRGLLSGSAPTAVRVMMLCYSAAAVACLVGTIQEVKRQGLRELAGRVEPHWPALQGRLSAAAWLLEDPLSGTPEYLARRCVEDAAQALEAVPQPPAPMASKLRRRVALALLALLGLAGVHLLAPNRLGAAWAALSGTSGSGVFVQPAGQEPPRLAGAEILYVFPAYTALPSRVSHGPGDLVALTGSVAQVRFRLVGVAHEVRAFMQDGRPLRVSVSGDGRHAQVEVPLLRDGGYGVALLSSDTEAWSRHLFRVRALPDASPKVRITLPARDLEMARPGGVLTVAGVASDDFAVAHVDLRFLVTAGSGETYRFQEGVLPLSLRWDAGEAHVEATLDIGALFGVLDDHAGVVSYYLEASDTNQVSGPGIGLSETFLVRIAGDESVPPERGGRAGPRAAGRISQRQILEETRRLHSRQGQMDTKDFQRETRILAERESELRGSFAGLSEEGGEWGHGDEGVEGAVTIPGIDVHLHGSMPLPYSPAVLQALNQAVRSMFQAELFLHLGDTEKAMSSMLEVIGFLQEARKYDRLLFRALPVAVSLDPAVRGVGDLEGVEDPPAFVRVKRVTDDGVPLLSALRHAVQSPSPVTPEQLQEWSHQAFALPDGMQAAVALAHAASSSETRQDDLRRAAALLALLLVGPENSASPAGPAVGLLADDYFVSLAGEAMR